MTVRTAEIEALFNKAVAILAPFIPDDQGVTKKNPDSFFGRRRARKGLLLLEQVILAAPEDHHSYWLVGIVMRALDDPQTSLMAFEKSYQLAPREKDTALEYAAGLAAVGRLDEAAVCARRTLEHAPDDVAMQKLLARMEAQRNDM